MHKSLELSDLAIYWNEDYNSSKSLVISGKSAKEATIKNLLDSVYSFKTKKNLKHFNYLLNFSVNMKLL
jgi:hypothetical protein